MTTIAQLEMLLSSLPSDIVGYIHDYAKHPVAEIFKEAQSNGKICIKHPALNLIERCLKAHEANDLKQFIVCNKLITFHSNRNPEFIKQSDWAFLKEPLRDINRKLLRLLEDDNLTTLFYSQPF